MTATTLRNGVSTLTQAANRDLAALWNAVSTAVEARQALSDVLPALVDTYGAAAAALAAQWYDDQRAKANVRGRFEAAPIEVRATGSDALAGWGVSPLFDVNPDWNAARTLVEGGLQRRIANAARSTVTDAAVTDPQARGWQRQASGGCSFCSMLAGRGAVYTEASADFASHDHCNCVAVPAFQGQPLPVKPYKPSERNTTDADRARVRAWIASH